MANGKVVKKEEQIKDEIIEILSFVLGSQEFALEVDYVEMVIEKLEITRVPNSKDFIKGVMNLRGRIVPVVNLTGVLSLETNIEEFENVLVAKIDDMEVGFLVNEVKEVVRTKESDIDVSPKSEQFEKKVKGIVQKGRRLIIYLDMKEIMNYCEGVR